MYRTTHILAIWIFLIVPMFAQAKGNSQQPANSQGDSSQSAGPPLVDFSKLEFTRTAKAAYPQDAQGKHIQGRVWVKLTFTETGDVEKVEVVSGNPILTDSALAAAKKFKLKPYIVDGQPVKIATQVAFDFAFTDKTTDVPIEDQKVELSPGLTKGMLIHQVAPFYPEQAKRFGIQGTVVLRATIGKDGLVKDLKPISGPAELIPAAVGAVQQWRYRPYILAGEPVAVATTITVNFRLSQR